MGAPAGGSGLSETGSDAGDALLDNDSALDAMSLDEEREDKENEVTTPDDEPNNKPNLRLVCVQVTTYDKKKYILLRPRGRGRV